MAALLRIVAGDLDDADVAGLLADHLADMRAVSPPGSVHALDLSALRHPAVTFWTLLADDRVVGCVALKELDPGHGELKSMRVAAQARGRGLGTRLLDHVLAEARARGYHRVSLETGSMAFFAPAHRLYTGAGFTRCPPLPGYSADPNSFFFTLELADPGGPTAHSDRSRPTSRR